MKKLTTLILMALIGLSVLGQETHTVSQINVVKSDGTANSDGVHLYRSDEIGDKAKLRLQMGDENTSDFEIGYRFYQDGQWYKTFSVSGYGDGYFKRNLIASNYIKIGRVGIKGTYDSNKVQGIWSIDTNWGIDVTNNNFGNQYGIVYAHTNSGSSSNLDSKTPIAGWGHQILFVNNGLTKVSISSEKGSIWAKETIRANYFLADGTIGFSCIPGNGRGLRLWNSDSYKIYMSSYSDGTWGGRLDNASDYNMYFKMSGGTNRGWYFKNTTTGKGVHIVGNGDIIAQGKIEATEIKVSTAPGADFVFEENYELPDLQEVETFIQTNKHLPNIPSAATMEENGVNLAEMNKLLLQKIEELTLYAIEQKEEADRQMAEVKELKETHRNTVETLEERLAKIEALLLTN